jgi:hypothetical protein
MFELFSSKKRRNVSFFDNNHTNRIFKDTLLYAFRAVFQHNIKPPNE